MERSNSRLELSSDEMRRLGHRIVDILVEHVELLAKRPVSTVASRAELDAAIGRDVPREPRPIDEVLDVVERDILGNIAHVDHPRFFAYVPGAGNFVGAMADALAAGFNVFAGAWPVASGPSYVELLLVDWLCGLCGLPATSGGLFVSGGSMANLTALVVARDRLGDEERERAIVYYSDETHSSIARALDVIGVPEARRRVIGRAMPRHAVVDIEALASQIGADRAAGLRPWCVVANAGTTGTGACDPLEEIAALCHGGSGTLWMHVDAAYGGGVLLSDEGREALRGIERADSVSLDPHKWLFQPFDIGCLLVRDAAHLEQSFESVPAYLRDSAGTGEVNFRDRGIELTRPFRALKLWMSLQVFGTDALAAGVERGRASAALAAEIIETSATWSPVATGGEWMGIVLFRHARFAAHPDASDDAHRRLARLLVDDGLAMLSTTEVDGRVCLRLCTINPRTTDEDIRATLRRLEELADTIDI